MKLLIVALLLVHGMALARDPASIQEPLKDGEAFLGEGKFDKALEACRKGLAELGYEYYSDRFIDDSGMPLIAAGIVERDGNLGSAAAVTCSVLRQRFDLWLKKRELDQRPNQSFKPVVPERAG